jgi:hypothetical protein
VPLWSDAALRRFLPSFCHWLTLRMPSERGSTHSLLPMIRTAADLLRGEIVFLRRGERYYDVRHRHGSEWTRRIERALDAIEADLLPRDGRAAFDLLTFLVDNESVIIEHCHDDDSDAAAAFERARQLLDTVARSLAPRPAVTRSLPRAMQQISRSTFYVASLAPIRIGPDALLPNA